MSQTWTKDRATLEKAIEMVNTRRRYCEGQSTKRGQRVAYDYWRGAIEQLNRTSEILETWLRKEEIE